jgi:hypothetical protein
MHDPDRADFVGQQILIVESELAFLPYLQSALEEQGAETLAVTDPYSPIGAERMMGFQFSAAVVNSVHRSVATTLKVPIVLYGMHADVPARPDAILQALSRRLSDGS